MSVDPTKPVVFEIIYDDLDVENILKTAGGFASTHVTQGLPGKSPPKTGTAGKTTNQPLIKVETSPQTKQTGRVQKRGKESISAAVLRITAKARKTAEAEPVSDEPENATAEQDANSDVEKSETVQAVQSPDRKHPIQLIINSPRVAVAETNRRYSPYHHQKEAAAGEDAGKHILEEASDSIQEGAMEEGEEVEYVEVEEELPELYSDEEDVRDGEARPHEDGANEIVIVQNVHQNELEREMLEHEMEDVHALAEFAALAHQEELKSEPMEQLEYPTSSYHAGTVAKADQYDAEVVSLTEADFLATKKKPFVCEICYKGYSEKYTLKVHMRLHTGENPYPCADCKKGFPTKTQLDSHMRKHYSEKVMCEVCKLIVDNKHQLSAHMKDSGCIADVTCKICHKTFHNRSNLSRHVLLHSSVYPFNCEFCDRSFAVRASYDRHMRSHSDMKEHICESCGRGFNQKTEWKLHMARCDMSQTPYQCKICKRAFADKGHLIKHMEKHDPGNPHICGVCHKSFSNANSLRLHGFIHTGNYPLQCQFCSKGFTTRSTLRAHMTVHTGERPYPCKYCGKAFAQLPGLRAHITLVHPEDVDQQEEQDS